MAYIYDLSDAWAASGTVFTGIKLSVTDTASAAGSLLMDLQVGGVSRFRVDKTEGVYFRTGSRAIEITDPYGIRVTTGTTLPFSIGTTSYAFLTAAGWAVNAIGFGISTGPVTFLQQDGNTTHTLAQRNGVNAQAFNLYNTYTDASNYERGFMRFVSNTLRIGTEKLGTGAARALELQTDGATRITLGATGGTTISGSITIDNTIQRTGRFALTTAVGVDGNMALRSSSGSAGALLNLTEMTAPAAPSANQVHIYAEDDGAGKTRLMALFATGAAVQIAIEP